MKRSKNGFTLVEILIVLAIIMLLAAIIFPVFNSARSTARKTACSSNLRQIGLALQAYVQDAGGRFPRNPIAGNVDTNCGWAEMVFPYTRSTQVFQCPAFPYGEFKTGCPARQETDSKEFLFYNWRGSYDLNLFVKSSMISLRNPSGTILISDGTGNSEYFGVEDNVIGAINPRDFTKLGNRHNYGSNVAFADGHVKWMKYDDLLDINLWKAR